MSLTARCQADHRRCWTTREAHHFRALAKEIGELAASLAHRYALSMEGYRPSFWGEESDRAPRVHCSRSQRSLDPDLVARIDAAVDVRKGLRASPSKVLSFFGNVEPP